MSATRPMPPDPHPQAPPFDRRERRDERNTADAVGSASAEPGAGEKFGPGKADVAHSYRTSSQPGIAGTKRLS